MTAQSRARDTYSAQPDTPEADLVAGARAGSEAAVRELIRRLNPRLFRIARGIADSDAEAEEIVQETYLTAFTRLGDFHGTAAFATWITRIAINTALMRRRGRPSVQDYDTVTETETPQILAFPGLRSEMPETALARAQIRGLLEQAVAELPPDLRLPFVLHAVEGMSVLAIARDLSLNPVTVRTRVFRARRRLRVTLERHVRGGFEAIFPFDGARCAAMADRVVAALGRLRER
jgi:RNA polymerase sigma-70 factor (ECF subfamily)